MKSIIAAASFALVTSPAFAQPLAHGPTDPVMPATSYSTAASPAPTTTLHEPELQDLVSLADRLGPLDPVMPAPRGTTAPLATATAPADDERTGFKSRTAASSSFLESQRDWDPS